MKHFPRLAQRSETGMPSAPRARLLLVSLTLLVLLSGCGSAQLGTGAAKPTASPTLNATLQHYAVAVHTYYQSFSDAIDNEGYNCRFSRPAPWAACQTLTATVLATGHTLLAQLPVATPPAQLQAMNIALTHAAQAALSAYMQRAPAVTTHDDAAFENGNALIDQAVAQQCAPVNQFNDIAPSGTHIEAPHGFCATSFTNENPARIGG